MFNMEIGDAPEEAVDGEEPSHNKLETMIKELSHALSGKNLSKKLVIILLIGYKNLQRGSDLIILLKN